MKRISLCAAFLMLSFATVFAQNDKTEMTDAVRNHHYWLSAAMVDHFVTVNLSQAFRDKMMKEQDRPVGINTLSNIGAAISVYLDYINGATLNKMCGFGVNGRSLESNKPICEDQIKENKGKISVTINSGDIRLTEDSYKLLFLMGSTVAEFLKGSKYNQSTGKGWKPKAASMSIIINSGKSEADLGARWNADFSIVTITTSPYIEVSGWSDKIMNVLEKGVVK